MRIYSLPMVQAKDLKRHDVLYWHGMLAIILDKATPKMQPDGIYLHILAIDSKHRLYVTQSTEFEIYSRNRFTHWLVARMLRRLSGTLDIGSKIR